jgi:hypothetical protein
MTRAEACLGGAEGLRLRAALRIEIFRQAYHLACQGFITEIIFKRRMYPCESGWVVENVSKNADALTWAAFVLRACIQRQACSARVGR